jgi:hypothetical protein
VIPEINSGFASCYPKFSNKIRVSSISGSASGIPGSGFGLRVFCPVLVISSRFPRKGVIRAGDESPSAIITGFCL